MIDRRFIFTGAAAVVLLALLSSTVAADVNSATRPLQVAAICVKTGEKIIGDIKTCFYNCSGAGASVNVPATTVCPITVRH